MNMMSGGGLVASESCYESIRGHSGSQCHGNEYDFQRSEEMMMTPPMVLQIEERYVDLRSSHDDIHRAIKSNGRV